MMINAPALLKKLALATSLLLSCFTTQAQLDFETAKEVTGFANSSNTVDEIIFTETGQGRLVNGSAQIFINPAIATQIEGDRIDDMVIVSIQLEGKSNGVYISKKDKNSFTIKELRDGSSNASFLYSFVLKKQ